MTAVCAVLCDMNSFEDMAFWAEHKEVWLKRFLKLAGGIPSQDTFNRVFRLLVRAHSKTRSAAG